MRVYISADYDENSGDREVVKLLDEWGSDNRHKTEFVDMSKVASGSVSNDPDCRICDLKAEFNRQINASSAVIFIVGDMTAQRSAGSECYRNEKQQFDCYCTPYKQNCNGTKLCKVYATSTPGATDDVGNINRYSYLRHEFEQAKKKQKEIIILYNSLRKESAWLPSYMKEYENIARPFWIFNALGNRVGDYLFIKEKLGF